MEVFNSLSIPLCVGTFEFQEHAVLEWPFEDNHLCLESFGLIKIDKLIDFELIVFVLESVGDNMAAEGNKLDSLELIANFPEYVINAKL